ncbi:hypothetical protein [Longispora albida]|uniref:hypothetical protein n=1 Tax=Longispora albida TaxID=203523 RepID=UPI00037E31D0|nr:hypothetical protein [Longispora albida]
MAYTTALGLWAFVFKWVLVASILQRNWLPVGILVAPLPLAPLLAWWTRRRRAASAEALLAEIRAARAAREAARSDGEDEPMVK